MDFAVELVLDKPHAESIKRQFELTDSILLELEAGPHVSLAVFENVDNAQLMEVARSLAKNTHAFYKGSNSRRGGT
jgi:hypothetical protein